jgi:FlaG/FlaF family flagellin (archaellin)
MKNKTMKNKKAQSQIISTVLLVLVVLILIVVIISFAIPFVRDRLERTNCLDLVNQVKIINHPQYTCYDNNHVDSAEFNMSVRVGYGDDVELIDGFQLVLNQGGSSNSFEITATTEDKIRMSGSSIVELPEKNGERTYILLEVETKPDSVEVYPILKDGRTCDTSEPLTSVSQCFTPFK